MFTVDGAVTFVPLFSLFLESKSVDDMLNVKKTIFFSDMRKNLHKMKGCPDEGSQLLSKETTEQTYNSSKRAYLLGVNLTT
jgi:hypothetical protein